MVIRMVIIVLFTISRGGSGKGRLVPDLRSLTNREFLPSNFSRTGCNPSLLQPECRKLFSGKIRRASGKRHDNFRDFDGAPFQFSPTSLPSPHCLPFVSALRRRMRGKLGWKAGSGKEKREEKIAGGRRVMNNTWLPVTGWNRTNTCCCCCCCYSCCKEVWKRRGGKNSSGRVVV